MSSVCFIIIDVFIVWKIFYTAAYEGQDKHEKGFKNLYL